jgi:hypothetical protein
LLPPTRWLKELQLIKLFSEVFRDKNAGGSIIKGPSAWRFRDGGYGSKK